MKVSRRDFIAACSAAGMSLAGPRTSLAQLMAGVTGGGREFSAPGDLKVEYFGQFSELPLGAVRARGWIEGWLKRQLEGLTGHPENLGYPYDTCMLAGRIPPPQVKHGADWWPYEQSSYFFDGAVRLGLLLESPAAQKIPSGLMDYVLGNSGPGKIGESTWGWPNVVAGRALMAEYSGTGNSAAAEVLRTYLLNGVPEGGRDGFLAEQALYLYGLTGDQQLRDIAEANYDRYFFSDILSFSNERKIRSDAPFREHGVTAAEQLKLLPLMYSYTGNADALELAKLAYGKAVADSMMPDGGMASSESLVAASFDSLHETCDITDWSWGFGYMLMASGEGGWGDRIERATFNALPGAVTKDFKQLQYFSSVNQVLASSTCCSRYAMTRMSYRAAHETECCTGNVNRAMPNYVTRMWMRSKEGLAATLYGPCELTTKVNGQAVGITETTEYPFRETVTFTVKLERPESFALQLRIPEWCDGATVRLNGKAIAVHAAAGNFAELKREFSDGDVVTLRLPMKVAIEKWFDGKAGVVRRGPLVYSLKISERRVESTKDSDAIRRVLKGNDIEGFPAVEFFPESEWRYGIESGLEGVLAQVKESAVGENPFLAESVPTRLTLPLRKLAGWALDWVPVMSPSAEDLKLAPKNPQDLPGEEQLKSPGKAARITLVPYGATHLRLTTFPLIG